jgi:hypothetical protein
MSTCLSTQDNYLSLKMKTRLPEPEMKTGLSEPEDKEKTA